MSMSEVDGTRLDDARDISESRGGLAPSPLPVRLYRARSVGNRCQCGYDESIVRVSVTVYMVDQSGHRQRAFVLDAFGHFASYPHCLGVVCKTPPAKRPHPWVSVWRVSFRQRKEKKETRQIGLKYVIHTHIGHHNTVVQMVCDP